MKNYELIENSAKIIETENGKITIDKFVRNEDGTIGTRILLENGSEILLRSSPGRQLAVILLNNFVPFP